MKGLSLNVEPLSRFSDRNEAAQPHRTRRSQMIELINNMLAKRFPKGPVLREFLSPILSEFIDSGSCDANTLTELQSDNEQQFWSKTWEALLYRRLKLLGGVVRGGGAGPDFHVTLPSLEFFVEATVPAPEGIPEEWFSEVAECSVPFDEILLRWTSSIRDKNLQHQQHVKRGSVAEDVPFVIAINACRLQMPGFSDEVGVSQWPYAVEAVFPIGPLAVPVDRTTGKLGDTYQSVRFSITKGGNVSIPTDSFLRDEYSDVSAIVGCSGYYVPPDANPDWEGLPHMCVVHNPRAKNPLPHGWLPGATEYLAVEVAQGEYELSCAVSSAKTIGSRT